MASDTRSAAATKTRLEIWDRDHVWHPFTPTPATGSERNLIIERAESFFLIDIDGNRYIDGVSSLWCNVHGHRVPELDEAIRQQLDQVAHSTLLGLTNVPAVRLARRLVELAPPGLPRVFFSDNGSTAVEVALKMAFQYWRQRPDPRPAKTKFLAFSDAYHGDTIGSASLGGIAHFQALFGPLLFATVRAPHPYCYRCPLGLTRDRCQTDCITAVIELIRQHRDELAAIAIEPLVQAAAGMIVAPHGFLRRIRQAARENDVLFIADEVAVGFGRTGAMFACEQEDVRPDFLCIAKGLSAGYLPIAATLTTDEIYSAFVGRPEERRGFYHGHTFGGNPLGAAVALRNLDLFESRRILADLPPKVDLLRRWLLRMSELPAVGDVRQCGMMAGVELVRDKATKEPFPVALQMGKAVCQAARRRGALLRPLGNVIVLMPPLAMDLQLLDNLCDIVYQSIHEVCANPAVTSFA